MIVKQVRIRKTGPQDALEPISVCQQLQASTWNDAGEWWERLCQAAAREHGPGSRNTGGGAPAETAS